MSNSRSHSNSLVAAVGCRGSVMRMLVRAASWRARTGAAVDRGGGGVGQCADRVGARRLRSAEGGGRCGSRGDG
jgi:hypothetical protein